jgi:hypothetical protein
MRPGAGYLPALAPGRPRGSSTPARRVTLLRSTSHPGYRVYSEEEFLAAADPLEQTERERAPIATREPRRAKPLLAVTALAAAFATVIGAVAIRELRSSMGADRKSNGRSLALRSPLPERPAGGGGSPASASVPVASRAARSTVRQLPVPVATRRVAPHRAQLAAVRAPSVARTYIRSQSPPYTAEAVVASAARVRPEFGFER